MTESQYCVWKKKSSCAFVQNAYDIHISKLPQRERERERDRERVRVLATVPSGIEGKIASAVCQRRLIKAKTE